MEFNRLKSNASRHHDMFCPNTVSGIHTRGFNQHCHVVPRSRYNPMILCINISLELIIKWKRRRWNGLMEGQKVPVWVRHRLSSRKSDVRRPAHSSMQAQRSRRESPSASCSRQPPCSLGQSCSATPAKGRLCPKTHRSDAVSVKTFGPDAFAFCIFSLNVGDILDFSFFLFLNAPL